MKVRQKISTLKADIRTLETLIPSSDSSNRDIRKDKLLSLNKELSAYSNHPPENEIIVEYPDIVTLNCKGALGLQMEIYSELENII